ncbi:high-affinity Zn(2+) transporter zrt1 [Monascus purpureus]|uniref:High-affinity Zn(2+) transporter zrt1 n=1 Tax=Monascus purpureus TaxID=5098 RepID=A0A507QZG7_MONPU|nr:high-affinity Zn(2+) transporter zrt1 [Monascus purpureus]BDD55421.1 hypothetical protein MAP00_000943 [Monascus purpureus]
MPDFDPNNVNLTEVSQEDIVCWYAISGNDYDGRLGARVSSIFVIGFISTATTLFPVIAKRVPSWKIPFGVYLFARYFGTGVIVATAFIHLLDPSYSSIGPNSCIGISGHWGDYSWCAAIVLSSMMMVFLLDLAADVFVEWKYGVHRDETAVDSFLTGYHDPTHGRDHVHRHPENEEEAQKGEGTPPHAAAAAAVNSKEGTVDWREDGESIVAERSFRQQIAAFLILEFGVIFHSVIIGLNLGVVGDEFSTLYPVLVFHQSFEGLGIGARMSAIPFGKHKWLPWILCLAYGLTTPISIAIGLGVRTSYAPNSKTAMIVQGVLDAISAGILIYTGLVELLARDFLFDPDRTKSRLRLLFMVVCMLFGAGIMALLGKWA